MGTRSRIFDDIGRHAVNCAKFLVFMPVLPVRASPVPPEPSVLTVVRESGVVKFLFREFFCERGLQSKNSHERAGTCSFLPIS